MCLIRFNVVFQGKVQTLASCQYCSFKGSIFSLVCPYLILANKDREQRMAADNRKIQLNKKYQIN